MDHSHPGGFPSPWAAVLAPHNMGAPGLNGAQHPFHAPNAHAHHPHAHHGAMDLHVSQAFPYYRYREDALCWTDRAPMMNTGQPYDHPSYYWLKPSVDDVGNPTSVNARILELRKEKSRDAARSRRGKENYEFYELAKMLPLPAAITSQLDKASIIRLTISYLKLRDFSGHGDPPWGRDNINNNNKLKGAQSRGRSAAGLALDLFEQHQGTHILQSLDGFALSVAADGRFLYISETVSIYLGLSQVEMTGSSIFDYIHHQDHAEVAEQLGLGLVGTGAHSTSSQGGGGASPGSAASEEGVAGQGTNNPDVNTIMSLASNSAYKGLDRAFCVRMKSTLTKRGCHFKSSGYRVVLMLCRLRPQYTFSHARKAQPPLLGMVALAIALPPPSVHEIRLEQDMFVTRINFDFSIAHCEPRVSELLDYSADELTGKNLYALCHGEDANKLRKCHVDLINKGQVLTHYYRLMNKSGGYTWIQTCATVVCSSKNADEQNIICVNYVISGREHENLILDCCQMGGGSTVSGVKREEANNDGGAGSPGADPPLGGLPPAPNRTSNNVDNANDQQDSTRPAGGGPVDNLVDGNTPRRGQKRKITEEETSSSDEIRTPPKRSVPSPPSSNSSCEGVHNMNDVISRVNTETTSVKDLEHAMSKHLPATPPSSTPLVPTDFSTDALLKQQQKTTIQWIGAHREAVAQAQAQMPATALLRQLYANRESVIRATTRPAPPGFYGEGQSTPPGETPYLEGSGSQFMLQHQKGDAFSNLVSSYGGYSMDYHSAMTPPSSVSPRDKSVHSGGGNYDGYGTYGAAEGPSLPLKPQPYPATMHGASLEAYGALEQSQFYPHHGSFHLYHKGSPSAGWYTTPS